MDIAAVNDLLHEYCQRQTGLAAEISPRYARLWQAIDEYIQRGGKRLRPDLVLLSYQASGGRLAAEIVPVAAAWELLHVSLLIHDDIIDEDFTRHGAPNIAGGYVDVYKILGDATEQRRQAASVALLAGDLALSGAYQLISEASAISAERQIMAIKRLTRTLSAVAGGQLLDIEAAIYPDEAFDPTRINTYKTALYSFSGPLQAGAELVGAPAADIDSLASFGIAVGNAYQLVDDLLGMFGDESVTGKSADSDLREGKRTLLIRTALEALNRDKASQLRAVLDGQSDDYALARQLIAATDSRSIVAETVEAYHATARQAVNNLSWPEEYRQRLRDVVTANSNRGT